jgi:hypothetical protein
MNLVLMNLCIGIYTAFLHNKNNGLQCHQTPTLAGEHQATSFVGEGWSEEIKIKHLNPPHPNPFDNAQGRLFPQGRSGIHLGSLRFLKP